MTPEEIVASFRSRAAALPGSPAIAAARETALARFAELGYPTRRLEDWRYTDPTPIATGDFELFPRADSSDRALEAVLERVGIAADEPAIVFVDGFRGAQRNVEHLPAGVELLHLPESLERYGPPEIVADRPFAALNVAFASHGAGLRVGRGVELEHCLHLVFVNGSSVPLAVQPQLTLRLAANARAKIAIHLVDGPKSASWTNLLTKIELKDGAHLELYRVQDHGPEALHTELVAATLHADASLRLASVDIGGRLVRNDIELRLVAPGASCDLAGIALCSAEQHVDNHVAVEHIASQTSSEQTFRSIVGARGRSVFNGKVVVHEGTKGIDSNQASDNLLLADSGEIDAKPELEIHADDVKCSHGATVGELDEAQLFYLRTRGLVDAAARGLLTLGFANEILRRMATPGLGHRLVGKFGLEVPEDPNWTPTV